MAKKGELDKVAQYVKNKLPQTGFFSTLDELITGAPFEKAPLEQWKNYLKPGRTFEREGVRFPLKQEELAYSFPESEFSSGFPAAFHGESISKEDMRKIVQDKRPDFGLKLGVTKPLSLSQMELRFPDELGIASDSTQVYRQGPRFSRAQYSDYAHGIGEFKGEDVPYEESAIRSSDFGPYGTHFGPDVISHSRTTVHPVDRYGTQSQLMRLIEEIQSDRHQAAAYRPWDENLGDRMDATPEQIAARPRRGYLTSEEEKEIDDLESQHRELNLDTTEGQNDLAQIMGRLAVLNGKVPDAPFKDPAEYALLELKNQMLNAAKEEQDYLGLIRGKDVSERFSHTPDQAAGTAYTYDKVYRSALDKLARQYGAEVREVPTNLKASIDAATPTMRGLETETIPDLMQSIWIEMNYPPDEGPTVYKLGDVRRVFNEMREALGTDADPQLINDIDKKLKSFEIRWRRGDTDDPAYMKDWEEGQPHRPLETAWNLIRNKLETLHDRYVEMKQGDTDASVKKFPSMVLTPEVRERILKAGVPIWSLGALAAGLPQLGANEEPTGFAKGGVSKLKELADEFGDRNEDSISRNRRMLAGLASQIYGMNEKSGEPELLGGDLASVFVPDSILRAYRRMRGEPEVQSHGPGMIDEIKSMMFGTQGSHEADERLEKLKAKIRQEMEVSDPHGFQENMDEALGTMLGQLPVPGSAAKGAVRAALPGAASMGQKLARLAKRVADPAVEWFAPTTNPSWKNYLTGALFGGSLGAGVDYLDEKARGEREIENFMANWQANHPDSMPFAEGGAVEGTAGIQSMLDTLRSRLNEITPESMPELGEE